ncbi:MAG: bifunctional 2-keto-4-hydroxyglutarate aldolase/2-keto-3-deoxy-6-phosphogluconate aldolase [Eubacteriales bacterium]|nr:bifunctional 2-keto-4-hydroxyglutarate aldolase/2-keto-3-deoxy-6-phosphogluconate aldolase [Eubacteriales bacterium]
MGKSEVIQRITECGVVAVVRAENEEQAVKIAEACIKAGIVGIEITFTMPGAVNIIQKLCAEYSEDEVIVGAGTVLDRETARTAILAGAKYVVSPCLDVDTVMLCNSYDIACMPGAMTVKEAVDGMKAGADIIKIFPGDLFGPKIIKAFKGPLPHMKMMPTGGVDVSNAGEWIKAGAVALGAGSSLTAGAKKGDYDSIVSIGNQLIGAVRKARSI